MTGPFRELDKEDYLERLVGGILYETREDAERADRGYRLNLYEVTREYGGPEEGGWWYTLYVPTGDTVILHPNVPWVDAADSRDQLQAFADVTNRADNPRGIYSVIGRADLLWMCEDHEPRRTPEYAPHYE